MKKMSKGMLMTALICGAVYLGGSPVYASELQEFSLDEYVVTAARTETKLVDTPANISVVDAQTIEERHYQDVSEVLKDVPGANVMDSGSGAFEKAISLNGDTRVLILVDGRKMEIVSGTSSGRASVDMGMLPDVNLIERIEILKGAGGALYGSDAVGGVVNIITKKADSNFGKVSFALGSSDTKDYSAMYSMRNGKTGITLSASKYEQDYYKFKDIKTNKTVRWPEGSNIDSEKISLKINQDFNEYCNLELGYDYSQYDGLSSGSLNNSSGTSFTDKENKNLYTKINWEDNKSNKGYFQYYHNEYNYLTYHHKTKWLYGDVNEKTNGVDIQQELNVNDVNKLVVGMSWRDSEVLNVQDGNSVGDRSILYEESIDNLAFFLNDTWELFPSWTLNAGIRYDDHSSAGEETTLSAGLNKRINDNSHIYLNWGEVFKSPTTTDLFDYWSGNRNLKAETGETWNIGYSTTLNEKTSFGINYFESDLDDAIVYVYPKMENVDKLEKRGLELSLNHKLNNNVDIEASYSYVRAKNNNGNGFERDINYIPNTYRLGVHYKDGKWDSNLWLRLGSGASLAESHSYDKDHAYLESSYCTVDFSVTYKARKDLDIFIKGYNLFNEAYGEFAGAYQGTYNYPAQSRRFIVGAEYKF